MITNTLIRIVKMFSSGAGEVVCWALAVQYMVIAITRWELFWILNIATWNLDERFALVFFSAIITLVAVGISKVW